MERSHSAITNFADLSDEDSISLTETHEEASYAVKAVIAERLINDETYYLVEWDNYDLSECTWEPFSSFHSLKPLERWIANKEAGNILSDHQISQIEKKIEQRVNAKQDRLRRREEKKKRLHKKRVKQWRQSLEAHEHAEERPTRKRRLQRRRLPLPSSDDKLSDDDACIAAPAPSRDFTEAGIERQQPRGMLVDSQINAVAVTTHHQVQKPQSVLAPRNSFSANPSNGEGMGDQEDAIDPSNEIVFTEALDNTDLSKEQTSIASHTTQNLLQEFPHDLEGGMSISDGSLFGGSSSPLRQEDVVGSGPAAADANVQHGPSQNTTSPELPREEQRLSSTNTPRSVIDHSREEFQNTRRISQPSLQPLPESSVRSPTMGSSDGRSTEMNSTKHHDQSNGRGNEPAPNIDTATIVAPTIGRVSRSTNQATVRTESSPFPGMDQNEPDLDHRMESPYTDTNGSASEHRSIHSHRLDPDWIRHNVTCRRWLIRKECSFGSMCRWAHEPCHLLSPKEDAVCYYWARGNSCRWSSRICDHHHARRDPVTGEFPSPDRDLDTSSSLSSNTGATVTRRDITCRYWFLGHCRLPEEACDFLHRQCDYIAPKRRIVCNKWITNSCKLSDTACGHYHCLPEQMASVAKARTYRTCELWKQGRCKSSASACRDNHQLWSHGGGRAGKSTSLLHNNIAIASTLSNDLTLEDTSSACFDTGGRLLTSSNPEVGELLRQWAGFDIDHIFAQPKGRSGKKVVFLVVPDVSSAEVYLLVRFLQSRQVKIYLPESRTSWDEFRDYAKTTDSEGAHGGAILWHPTVNLFWKIPYLSAVLRRVYYDVFRMDMLSPDHSEEGDAIVRIFPRGYAICLTDYAIAYEPWETFHVLEEFYNKILAQGIVMVKNKIFARQHVLAFAMEVACKAPRGTPEREVRDGVVEMIFKLLRPWHIAEPSAVPSSISSFFYPAEMDECPGPLGEYNELWESDPVRATDVMVQMFVLWSLQHVENLRVFAVIIPKVIKDSKGKAQPHPNFETWRASYNHVWFTSGTEWVQEQVKHRTQGKEQRRLTRDGGSTKTWMQHVHDNELTSIDTLA